MAQQNRTENSEGDSHKQALLIFDKDAKVVKLRTNRLVKKQQWSNGTSRAGKGDICLIPDTKTNSKSLIDFHVKPITTKL